MAFAAPAGSNPQLQRLETAFQGAEQRYPQLAQIMQLLGGNLGGIRGGMSPNQMSMPSQGGTRQFGSPPYDPMTPLQGNPQPTMQPGAMSGNTPWEPMTKPIGALQQPQGGTPQFGLWGTPNAGTIPSTINSQMPGNAPMAPTGAVSMAPGVMMNSTARPG